MKLGPVTELDKINTVTSRNFTMVSCQEIVTSMSNLWQICSQSRGWIYKTGVIMVYKTYIFINNNFLSYEN